MYCEGDWANNWLLVRATNREVTGPDAESERLGFVVQLCHVGEFAHE
jgi:hypothetical protein